MGSPFGTIEAAAAVATPGTFIQLAPGTHAADQYLDNVRGTETQPIWIGGADGTSPTIDGGGEAIHLSRAAYVVLQNLTIRNQTANGINMDDGAQDLADETAAHHVLVRNVDIADVGGTGNQDCLKVSGINDLYVYDSHFARCGGGASGSGIDHVGCHRTIIARNTFIAMSGNAVQAKGGSTDIDIRQNRVHDGGERAFNLGGSTGFEFFRPPLSTTTANAEARRIRAYNNVVTGTTNAPFAFVGCVDCLVAHNLFYGDPRWLIRILQETTTSSGYTFEPARAGRVINNTFAWHTTQFSTHVNVGANTDAPSFTFSNNAWYAADNAGSSMPSLPVAETNGIVGMPPGYAEYSEGASIPMTLCAGPEANAGITVADVPGDYHGTCRPTSGAQNIGPLTCMP